MVGVVPHTKNRWRELSIPNTVAIGDGNIIQMGNKISHPKKYPKTVVRFVGGLLSHLACLVFVNDLLSCFCGTMMI